MRHAQHSIAREAVLHLVDQRSTARASSGWAHAWRVVILLVMVVPAIIGALACLLTTGVGAGWESAADRLGNLFD